MKTNSIIPLIKASLLFVAETLIEKLSINELHSFLFLVLFLYFFLNMKNKKSKKRNKKKD